jgi:hypothetical protein
VRRALPLAYQLARAEALLEQHPGDQALTEVGALLANAIQSHSRGEVSSAHAETVAALARLALDFSEALARAGGGR